MSFVAHLRVLLTIATVLNFTACVVKDDVAGLTGGAGGGAGESIPDGPLALSFADGGSVNLGTVAAGSTRYIFLSLQTLGTGHATVTGATHSNPAFAFDGGNFPGTGGTCGTTIVTNCSLAVTFTPGNVGTYSDTLTVNYLSDGTVASVSIALSATVLPPGVLTISNGTTYNFGTQIIGSVTDHAFTVMNLGGITVSSIAGAALTSPFSYKGGTYPGTGGTCGTTLAIGASCTVVTTYTPVTAGTHTGTLTLNYNNGTATASAARPLQGTAQSAALLTISDGATYNFGNTAINSTPKQKSFTVSNSGSVSATAMSGGGLAAPYVFLGGIYPGTGGSCGTTLAAGATCTVFVSYSPTVVGVANDTLELAYANGVMTATALRPIVGTGIAATTLTISENPTYDYGSRVVGSATDKSFIVTNSGPTSATTVSGTGLAAPFTFKGGTYPGTGGTCTATIATNCLITVTFTPNAAGLRTDTIQLDYNNGGTTVSAYRDVQGTGLSAATLTISDANLYDFGSLIVGASAEHTFTVTYAGQTPATGVNPGALVAPYAFKGGAYPGTGGTCGSTISANCTVVTTFNPIAAGTFNANLSLDYHDGVNVQNSPRSITGISPTPATLTISEAPDYDFGTKAVGTVTSHSFIITNTGQTAANSIVPANLTAPFAYSGGSFPGTGGDCAGSLAAAGSCTVVIAFSPLVVGSYSETFGLQYGNGVSTQTVDRSITGTGGSVANLSLSDGPTYSFGTVARAYTADAVLTVSNVGGSSATAISETTLSAPFTFKGGSFPGTAGTCTTTLVAGATCTVVIRYAPTSAANHAGNMTLSYANGTSTVTSARALSGVGANLTAIRAGKQHTCVLYSTGIIRCWGADNKGQLGNDATLATTVRPTTVNGITNALGIAVGSEHSCSALSNGRIDCWGSDSSGQLGNDTSFGDSALPTTVATTTDFVQVAAGGELTCGRKTGGTVQCWGDDSHGGNGNGLGIPNSDNATPVTVAGLSTTSDIAVGESHACAVETDADIECWGWNNHGQLGLYSTTDQYSSVAVSDLNNDGARVYAGGRVTAMRRLDGNMEVTGDDSSGQLGDGGGNSDRIDPGAFNPMDSALDLAFGSNHGCGLTSGGAVRCWGSDAAGQLGDNAGLADSTAPVAVSGIGTGSAITAGDQHSCAIATSGLVYCWGDNSAGQLGTGTSGGQSATAAQVIGL